MSANLCCLVLCCDSVIVLGVAALASCTVGSSNEYFNLLCSVCHSAREHTLCLCVCEGVSLMYVCVCVFVCECVSVCGWMAMRMDMRT